MTEQENLPPEEVDLLPPDQEEPCPVEITEAPDELPCLPSEAILAEKRISKRHRAFHPLADIISIITSIATALAIALFIRVLLVTAFIIPSGSMKDTLLVGDMILVNRFVYQFTEPSRGDLVVFHDPKTTVDFYAGDWLRELWSEYALNRASRRQDLVKRIIGLPGETVQIYDGKVLITTLDGQGIVLSEPYLAEPFTDNWGPRKVPNDSYLVLGDNRKNSLDGRWFGFLKRNLIMGRAFMLLFSIAPDTCRDNEIYDKRCAAVLVPMPPEQASEFTPELPGGNGNYWICPDQCYASQGKAYRDWWDKRAGPLWERIRWSRLGQIILNEPGPQENAYP